MSLQPLQPPLRDLVHFISEDVLSYFSPVLSSHLGILISGSCKISPDVRLVPLLHWTNEQSGDQRWALTGSGEERAGDSQMRVSGSE